MQSNVGNEIKITLHEPWMKQQVVDSFCKQYGNSVEQFSEFFSKFYDNDFQKGNSLRLVAILGDVVAGFASFCKWPYKVYGKEINSLQCGNVIISENFRGKGLYNKMLDYLNEHHSRFKIDLIIGFPIKEILKLYLKSQWKNPFNISWYISVTNIFSVLFPVNKKKMESLFLTEPKYQINSPYSNKIELVKTKEFFTWHKSYNFIFDYYFFRIEHENEYIEFTLKINYREKFIKELIIGDITTNSHSIDFIKNAFKKLQKAAFKTGFISFISIAINDLDKNALIFKVISNLKFKKIEKDIKFIYRNFNADENLLSNPTNWVLYRRDLDTW